MNRHNCGVTPKRMFNTCSCDEALTGVISLLYPFVDHTAVHAGELRTGELRHLLLPGVG